MNAMHMPGLDAHLNSGNPVDLPDGELESIVGELNSMTVPELVACYIEHYSEDELRELLAVDSTLPERIDAKRAEQNRDDAAANAADYHD